MQTYTYREPGAGPYPFCPGCGHSAILDHLHAALAALQLDPHRVVIVSDIGCVGMADRYFATHTFHGLHGRSVAYATGIKLANPELHVIVLIGDGGCGIGGHHLLNAARRNIGVCVLVFNNLNFGMTGGQHSVTTPHGARTSTTRGGNLERPLDIGATVAANGAAYVYRGTSFDRDLPERIAEAIATPGFALLDIWELCTAYYAPNNDYSRSAMLRLMSAQQMQRGLLQRADAPELSALYRAQAAGPAERVPFPRRPIAKEFEPALRAPARIVLAGSAGGKVKSTASLLAQAAMRCGLWCTQRDDYPVTVMSGYSQSEVILSPREIFYTGVERPDVLAILSAEGLGQVLDLPARMDAAGRIYVMPELAERVQTRARKIVFKPLGKRANKKTLALMALAAMLRDTGWLPLEALTDAIKTESRAEIAEEQLSAVERSGDLL
jgi:pyruvate/2-oxoacid:ferredoxin oxidoreductase beta subunit/Pyruvate/2-oxoacid:ferredoxin oxidoreductase gamma subunit